VSKTDLVRYVRCPYSWWLLDRGEITFEETVDEFQVQLIQEGVAFQQLVEASAAPVVISDEDWAAYLASDRVLLGTPTFENPRLHILGRPDGIDCGRGAVAPIEVKSHQEVTRSDELELAFYWLLLAPWRTRPRKPHGYLILRRAGRPRRLLVRLTDRHLRMVAGLLREIRRARRVGVEPRICSCVVCSRLRRDQVRREAMAREDLTLIHGIGRRYAEALEAAGFGTWRALLGAAPTAVVAALRGRSYFVSAAQVEHWQLHCRSYACGAPVALVPASPIPKEFIGLDLEYTPDRVWLVGAVVHAGGEDVHHLLWADNDEELSRALLTLQAVLAIDPVLPVLTWSGTAADLPMLRAPTRRLGLTELHAELERRHVDLYYRALEGIRLPIPQMGLKDVAEYLGITRMSPVADGLEAVMLYEQYRRLRGPQREEVRSRLLDYNRDDLDNLVQIAERLRELQASPAGSGEDRSHP
jgi:predicted RecB family nuclease